MSELCLRWLGCAALCALLAGCFPLIYLDREEYPSDWPAQAAAGDSCLGGRYGNDAIGRSAPMAHQLLETADPLRQVQQVRFSGLGGGLLRVQLLDAEGAVLVEERWQQGAHYSCEGGWLIRKQTNFAVVPALAGSESRRFSRATNGDLLVQGTSGASGMVLLFPYYRDQRFWLRYPLVAD